MADLPATPHSPQVSCCICEEPIPFADRLLQRDQQEVVCRNFECQRLYRQKAQLHVSQFNALLEFQRRQWRQRKAEEAARRQHREKIEQEEAAADQLLLAEWLAQHPEMREAPPDLMPLPSGLATLAPNAAERIAIYRQHIEKAIDEALACGTLDAITADQHRNALETARALDARFASDPKLHALSNSLCTICRGGCCPEGGDHAFISATTILRQWRDNPALTREDILQQYLDRVPTAAIAGACINQTASGCALPRGIRSDVCNSFFCEPIRQLHRHWPEYTPAQLLVIQRANHCWNRYQTDAGNAVVHTQLIDVEQL